MKSFIIMAIEITPIKNIGIPKILYLIDSTKLRDNNALKDLVSPHPGQAICKLFLNMHYHSKLYFRKRTNIKNNNIIINNDLSLFINQLMYYHLHQY